jgi:competence protein ComEA
VIGCLGAAVGARMARDPSNLAVTVTGVAVLVVVAGAAWFGLGSEEAPPAPGQVASSQEPDSQPIRVHVSGAVAAPGVVQLLADAIVADAVAAAGGAVETADLTSINLAAPLRAGERIIVPDTSHRGAGAVHDVQVGVDLNAATASELEALPGVGPVLAGRIVAFRTERGPFLSVEDLLDVPGIGESKLSQMRDSIGYP